MDGDDKEDGHRHGIFWGKSAINGVKKEDGWRRQRRWNKTWHFLGEKVPSMVTRKKMDGDDKEDGTRHGIFLGKKCHGRRLQRR